MPVDWDDLDIDKAVEDSANHTDEKLASKISSLTRMTDDEVKELFPKSSDVKKLTELMRIVKSAEDRNIKVKKISENIEDFGDIMFVLLEKLT
jgi:hypothetical protein